METRINVLRSELEIHEELQKSWILVDVLEYEEELLSPVPKLPV